ncbi:MAG TPA: cupin domain-containing protein [Paracoccaceae bacterium]|nr:cupin domain-containing protein [Paracoccaceae bacterium]
MSGIERLEAIATYAPPGHSGTTNRRLVTADATEGRFEMVHGRIAPGGVADRHHHEREYQAMYVLAGACDVALGEAAAVRAEAGAVVRIPPGLDHRVTSLGPEDLELLIVYSPPIARTS